MQPKQLLKPFLPDKPGVYLFWSGRKILYIGKAGNLKKRLASYWQKSAGQKTTLLLQEATRLELQKTESEIEALIREAELIKQYRPRYNILMRDDKNYFYVGITNPNFLKKISGWQAHETFPKIFVTHQPHTERIKNQESRSRGKKSFNSKFLISTSIYVGPFTSGAALKTTLKLLRRIFPYCTCKNPHKRLCLNAEIGRCLGFCCDKSRTQKSKIKNQNLGKIHNTNIKNIIAILEGKKQKLLQKLKKEMRNASKKQQYETAGKLRDQIAGLEDIFAHRLMLDQSSKKNNAWLELQRKLQKLFETRNLFERIEAYDISNISGTDATGSMVVFQKGMPDKNEYRKFKIKTVYGANDVAMIQEVVRRRMRHPEWRFPNLIVVDGGKPQLNAASREFRIPRPRLGSAEGGQNLKFSIIITALAKREEELYIAAPHKRGEPRHPRWRENKNPVKLKKQPKDILHLFQAVRDEAHRFAKKYHHKLREKKTYQ